MDAIKAVSLAAAQVASPASSPATEVSRARSSFGDIIQSMVAGADARQQNADQAMQQLHAGGEKNLHEAMLSMEKADISMRYMIQVRNKAIDAYQEIMRMQV
jgi:flagellar hook-basal body complex protein FliE